MQWRSGRVVESVRSWPGSVEYAVEVPGLGLVRALGYTAMVGTGSPGDLVLLNCSALLRGLGTGGLAFVVAFPDRLPPDPPGAHEPGHIVKARYTPQQQMFLAVDEQDSPHHAVMNNGPAAEGDLAGLPVIAADLHSALPAILAGIRTVRPTARVAYLMTDGGALPLAFSRSVAGLVSAGWLTATITVGQAFGGMHEAVTLHSGLLAARHVLDAEVAVVIQGPGNVGTDTPWGYSGVAAGEALNAAHTLRGRGVAALRVSQADPRQRHRGISHHSHTAYGRICLAPADVPVPAPDTARRARVVAEARELVAEAVGPLTLHEVPTEGLLEALRATPVPLSTMGRGLEEEREAFLTSAVAGRHAAGLVDRP